MPTTTRRPQPQDRLAKKPVERAVRVYLDDEPIQRLAEAREALAEATAEAETDLTRQIQLVRSAPLTSTEEVLAIDEGLRRARDERLAPYRKAVEQAEAEVLAASQVYRFRSIGRAAYADLIGEHPASDDDHAKAREDTGDDTAKAAYCADTFVPALLAAACVDPGLTVEEATEIYEEWNGPEVLELFLAAQAVHTQSRQVDLGKGSSTMRSSAPS